MVAASRNKNIKERQRQRERERERERRSNKPQGRRQIVDYYVRQ